MSTRRNFIIGFGSIIFSASQGAANGREAKGNAATSCNTKDYLTEPEWSKCVSPAYAPVARLLDDPSYLPTIASAARYDWPKRQLYRGFTYDQLFGDAPRDVRIAVFGAWPGHHNHRNLVPNYEEGENTIEGGSNCDASAWDEKPTTGSNLHDQGATSIIAAKHDADLPVAGAFARAKIVPVRVSVDTFSVAVDRAIARGCEVIHMAGYQASSFDDYALFPNDREGAPHPDDPTYRTGTRSPAFNGVGDYDRDVYLPKIVAVREALRKAADAGIFITQGAGNRDGRLIYNFIASRPEVIAVASSNVRGEMSPFNTTSPVYDIAAPGGDRRSGVPAISLPADFVTAAPHADTDDVMTCLASDKVSYLSGGSAAAAFVAAAAAIWKSYFPKAKPHEVRRALQKSCVPWPMLNQHTSQMAADLLAMDKLKAEIRAAFN